MEGDVNLPLGEISNQEIHDVWIDLYERNNQKSKAQIHVKLQWIHSKAKYYTIAAQKWQETIKKEEEELHEYERYISSLHEPFEGLRNLSLSSKQTAAVEIKGITEIEGQFVAIMNKAAFHVAKEQNPGEGFWKYIARFASLIEIVLAIFICFARPDFFDIIVGILTFLYVEHGLLKELISPRIIGAAVVASAILVDLIWFFIYSGNWTDTQYKDGNLEVGTRRFALLLTFINIIYKILFAAVLYMYYLQIVKQRTSVPKVIMRDVPV